MTAPPFEPPAEPRTALGKVLAGLLATTAAALGANLAETVSGEVGHTFLVPGAAVAADWCCPGDCQGPCGQAWVRLVQYYPSRAFPALDAAWSKVPGETAVQLEVGVLRCVAGLTDDGSPPTPEAMTADAVAALDDVGALRTTALGALAPRRVVVGPYSAVGPQGYCAGGTLLFTVALTC